MPDADVMRDLRNEAESRLFMLRKAVKRLMRAETEYHRAIVADEQPRLNRAGSSYACAKFNLYRVAGLK